MKQLFLMMGAPGSGKSTWAKRQLKSTDAYISRDEIRFSLLNDGDDYFSQEGEVYKIFIQTIVDAIKDDKFNRVFADASHLNEGSRSKLLNHLKKYIDLNSIEIGVIWLKTTLNTCLERNRNRDGRALVADDVIENMWRSQSAPSIKEGFNKVYIINEKDKVINIVLLDTIDFNNFVF